MNKALVLLKKYSPFILTTLGAAGVVSTSILTAKATLEANEIIKTEEYELKKELSLKEDFADIIKLTWKPYIPAIISGLSTITCIYGAHFLNKRTQASMASAYALLNKSYKEYIDKNKEINGEEADKNIKAEIAKSHYEESLVSITLSDYEGKEKRLFYLYEIDQYFEATFEDIAAATNKLNEEFAGFGNVSLLDFCDYLGINPDYPELAKNACWNSDGNYYEIKFQYERVQIDGDLECWILDAIA